MNLITIGERRFARKGTQPELPCDGTFAPNQGGLLFCDMAGEPFAQLVNNRFGERFFVTAYRHSDGRIYYMHGLRIADKEKLGLPECYVDEECRVAEALMPARQARRA